MDGVTSVTDVEISSRDAKKFVYNYFFTILVPVGDYTLGFLSNIKEPDPVFGKILSTFKFTK